MVVDFEGLEPLAEEVFNIWDNGSDLRWARVMWGHFAQAGLTAYSDDFERHAVLLRFLALGGIYRDYYLLSCDERTDLDYARWLAWGLDVEDELRPDWFTIGQMITWAEQQRELVLLPSGEMVQVAPGMEVAEERIWRNRESALSYLMDMRRKEVRDALVQQLGSVMELFWSFGRSYRDPEMQAPDNEDDTDEIEQEPDADYSSRGHDVTVYEWVSNQNCMRQHLW